MEIVQTGIYKIKLSKTEKNLKFIKKLFYNLKRIINFFDPNELFDYFQKFFSSVSITYLFT